VQHPAGASERRYIPRNLRLGISVNCSGHRNDVTGDLRSTLESDIPQDGGNVPGDLCPLLEDDPSSHRHGISRSLAANLDGAGYANKIPYFLAWFDHEFTPDLDTVGALLGQSQR